MSVPFNSCFGSSGSSAGYQITNSVRLRASASAYLSRTFGTPTSATTLTLSWWEKKSGLPASTMYRFVAAGFDEITTISGDVFRLRTNSTSRFSTTAVYRDPSAWMHMVLRSNGTDIKLYANNVEVGSYTGTPTYFNTAVAHKIGGNSGEYFDGYMADIYFIDGQALTPSSFGQTDSNGVWVPKAYTGTYGNNGFHLLFDNATSLTTLGYDKAGTNHWTCNNISVTAGVTYDSMVDTPTNNYATLNPLWTNASYLPTGANLNTAAAAAYHGTPGTVAIPSGMKAYWEFVVGSDLFGGVGVARIDATTAERDANPGVADSSRNVRFCRTQQSGIEYKLDGTTLTNNGAVNLWSSGEVWGVALDGAKLWIRNGSGTWIGSGDPAAGTNAYISDVPTTADIAAYINNYNSAWSINFGQRPFTYTPPTGFKALCTANLPAVAIPNPRKHFDVVTRTGTAATYSVTGREFAPDFVWVKSRGRAVDHALYDSVRGTQRRLETNNTDAEVTGDTTGITAFNSDGYTGGALDQINGTTATNSFVDWLWKANGAGSSNTAGSITSTVSANTTAGFSIVTYAKASAANETVGHGLGKALSMVIVRERNNVNNWAVWHSALAGTEYLLLNGTAAKTTLATMWNSAVPTSTVFSLGTVWGAFNHIAYCFAEIAGYSKFGSYTGNGSTDGPFVFCGFRPRWVLGKRTDVSEGWELIDSARDTANVTKGLLEANNSAAENATVDQLDFTANGFKVRNTRAAYNTSGATYIYAAFAEYPFGGNNVSPSPAR